MNTKLAKKSESIFNLNIEPETKIEDTSHLEKFAHQVYSELNGSFSPVDRLKVFDYLRELVKIRNEDEIRELKFHAENQIALADSLNSFIF